MALHTSTRKYYVSQAAEVLHSIIKHSVTFVLKAHMLC